ncbi:hypothetical protein [Streptomyces sp. NBC_00467]|uniref:hypothetical protein n=1 Tax=Streptomyces sp. NBC_00467 TaxID=2975752 RepID=UPI002E1952A0
MRLADLMGARVCDPAGTEIGHVSDVRLVEHPAPTRPEATLRVEGVVVALKGHSRLFSYDHRPVDGPWPLAWLARRAARHARWIPWDHVTSHQPAKRLGDPAIIRISHPSEQLPLLSDMHQQWTR